MTIEASGTPTEDLIVVPNAPVDEAAPAPSTEPTDANAAVSSPVDEKDAKQPEDLLSVIRSAIEPPAPVVSSAAEANEVAPVAEVEAPVAEGEAVVADADLPFHNHPRWKEVIAERDTFREDATRYGNITQYMETNGLGSEEVAQGFAVMAALKSKDPAKLAEARDYFQAGLESLDGMLGNVLPDDLQERVDGGLIDEDTAQEVARSRAAETLRSETAAERATATAETQAAADQQAASTAMISAVEAWEVRTKATDPDYAKKAALVQTTCQAIVQRTGKAPATPEEALALTDQALAEVNAQIKSLAPKPRAITPPPRSSSTPTTAEPKSLREAINSAIAR